MQSAVLTVVSPTLTTLVTTSSASDESDGVDDEVIPCGITKDVTAMTFVTEVMSGIISGIAFSRKNSTRNMRTRLGG